MAAETAENIEDTISLEKMEEMLSQELPSRKQLLEMLDSSDISEEMRETYKSMLRGSAPQVLGGYGGGTLMAVLFVMLIFSVISFFGYKLYKSIKQKELRREEKRKAKMMKKKK